MQNFRIKPDNGYLRWITNIFPDSDLWWKAAVSALSRQKMKQEESPKTNVRDVLSDLKSCTKKRDLQKGREIHTNAVEAGMDSDIYVANALINLYAKCYSVEDARTVFDRIQGPSVVSWNFLIMGYAENGQGPVALDMFSRMKAEGRCTPNSFTYVAALKACTLMAADGGKRESLDMGRKIHSEISRNMDEFMQSTLINLYIKCGSIEDAKIVFDSIQEPSVVSWNCLILGYADDGKGLAAYQLFSRMKEVGRCVPTSFTYVAALKACALLAEDGDEAGKRQCLERGRQIHSESGYHLNDIMQRMLINLYAKCGSMEESRMVFDSIQQPDVVSWNCLILGYADSGQGNIALDLFSRMKEEARCTPNSFTYVAALKACTFLAVDGGDAGKGKSLERARQIHSEIGCHINDFLQSTLINLYAKCGSMEDARTVFDNVQEPDLVTWNALILGYAENGQGLVGFDLFSRMKDEGRCAPNSFTFVAALMACCSIGALVTGRKIHSEITEFDSHVVTCLVDFYAKCGSVKEAREVFDLHPRARNVSTWTALLTGYAQFGDTDSVFSLFETMQGQGFEPNSVTFLCVLSSCCHAGLVAKAWEYLDVMTTRYKLTPTVKHYNCMIDLLGRANKLDEALALLQKMSCDPNAVTWTVLLGACRKWRNAGIGRWAFKSLTDLDQNQAPAYVVMAEIYGSTGMLEARVNFGACKLPGKAYVMDGHARTVEFVVGKEDALPDADVEQFLKATTLSLNHIAPT